MDAPDLEILSNDAPATPPAWQSYEDDDELLSFSVNHVLDKAAAATTSDNQAYVEDWQLDQTLDRRRSSVMDQDRRRSSGVAIQQLLSQLDNSGQVLHDSTSAALMMESSFETGPAWKIVVETAFASKYFRNDRKNIQCFPCCTLGAQRNATDNSLGHGKSTTWCRGAVNARAFAIDPETNIADIAMFEAFGAFIMNIENPKTKPLVDCQEKIRGNIHRVDGRSFEIKIAPTVWKFEPPLSKKKTEENRNQCFFVVVVCFRGREVGRCISPPFDLGSQKAEIRKKRAMVNDETGWGPKHLVLDTFAQASNWAMQTIGIKSPTMERKMVEKDEGDEEEGKAESVDTVESSERKKGFEKRNSPTTVSSRSMSSPAGYPQLQSGSQSAPIQKKQQSQQSLEVGLFHHHNNEQFDVNTVVTASVVATPKQVDHKRVSLALLLWLPPFGFIGAHHAYLGRQTYALTSALTLNLLLLGWIADAVRIPMLVYAANFPSTTKIQNGFLTFAEYFLVWILFGLLGAHRYVLGDWRSGLFMTLTIGGFGSLWLWDGFHLGQLHASGNNKSFQG